MDNDEHIAGIGRPARTALRPRTSVGTALAVAALTWGALVPVGSPAAHATGSRAALVRDVTGAISTSGQVAPAAARALARRPRACAVPRLKTVRAPERHGSRPNLLLITVDDMALKDLPYLPNVQRLLARQGTTMTNAISPNPICVPSRASLLTGQLTQNHGSRAVGVEGSGYRTFKDEHTLPVWLRRSGYATGFVGKYLNGYGLGTQRQRVTRTVTVKRSGKKVHRRISSVRRVPTWRHVPPGWSSWRGSIDMNTYNYSTTVVSHNGRREKRREYNTCGFARYADQFIASRARSAKPWYLWASYVAPHHGGPRDVGQDPRPDGHTYDTPSPHPRHRGVLGGVGLGHTPEMFEADTSDKRVEGTHSRWSAGQRRKAAVVRTQRLAALQTVDEVVGRHVALLRRTGQLDRTVIVFTSDNGYQVGEHRLMGKLWHYRNSSGVPLVIRGPGVPAGRTNDTLISSADLPVTLAGWARVKAPTRVDGADLSRSLASNSVVRAVPTVAYPVAGGAPLYHGVRVGNRWNYVKLRGGAQELYDWAHDPFELRNLARDPAHADELAQVAALSARLATCRGRGPRSCDGAALRARAAALAAK